MQVQLNTASNVGFASHSEKLSAALSKAEGLFPALGSMSAGRKQEFESILKEAYNELVQTGFPHEHKQSAARVFHLYGSFLYGGHMEHARQIYQLSLALQLDIEIPSLASCRGLEEVPQFLTTQPLAFRELEECIKEKNFARELFNDYRRFDIARSLVGLGYSLMNLKVKTPEIVERYIKIYADASDICLHINTQDSHWLNAEIVYNTGRSCYKEREKENKTVEGALATLKPLTAMIEAEGETPRALQMLAQIHNIGVMEMLPLVKVNPSILKQMHDLMIIACHIANTTPDFNINLRTMFLNNKFAIVFMAHKAGIELASEAELTSWCQQVIQEIQAAGHDFIYHAGYYTNVAAYEHTLGHKDIALKHLVTAQEINQKFDQDNTEVENLRAEILRP